MFQRFVFVLACAAMCSVLFAGCSAASDKAQDIVQDASSEEEAQAETAQAPLEMPENSYGIDGPAYLQETYGLESAENVDLIDSDQFAWLAVNKGSSLVIIADPQDEQCAEMLAIGEENAGSMGATIYAFEPSREAGDAQDYDALAQSLVDRGVANLDGLSVGTAVVMSKFTTDPDGNPTPVQQVVEEPVGIYDAMVDFFMPSCCG